MHFALVVLTALELSGDDPARAKPIYGVYQSAASRIDADKPDQQQFKDHLCELDMQGIADGENVTAGSIGGPAWEYQLPVDTKIAIKMLEYTARSADIDFERISADRSNPCPCYLVDLSPHLVLS